MRVRLVTSQPPTARDFASKAALGELCPPEQDDCTWSSCSLHKKIKTLLSYKRLRMERPYIAMLNIPKGVGKHLMGSSKRGHIDFWRYNGVCLTEFVQNAEGLNDDK